MTSIVRGAINTSAVQRVSQGYSFFVTLLFHVDESRDSKHHYHVGLLTDGPATAAVEAGMQAIVEQAFDLGVCAWEAELHGVEVFHGNDQWSKGTIDQRVSVFDQALGLLGAHGVEVVARGANLSRFEANYGIGNDPYVWEFSNLLERLNERCMSRQDYGLVIADEQSEHKETLRRKLSHAKKYGTGGYRSQVLERVLDTAHFVDSKLSRLTQLADMVAFVMRRRVGRPTEHDVRLEAVMQRWANLVYAAVPGPEGPVPHHPLTPVGSAVAARHEAPPPRRPQTCRRATPPSLEPPLPNASFQRQESLRCA